MHDLLREYNIKPKKYSKVGKVFFIETNDKKYVIKEKVEKDEIYEYLFSRSFDYIPNIVAKNDSYIVMDYIDEYKVPSEQKILDMIDLVSLLHNKTTHYVDSSIDDYKEIYENLKNNIEYLYSYYMDLSSIIESHVFMSPYEYTLIRNVSKIFSVLVFLNEKIDLWYNMVKDKTKRRLVVIHNNLCIDHFIESDKNYFISWGHSRIDLPIFDIYKLYLNHCLDYEFSSLFSRYEKNYPLLEDEKLLFFILISMPKKLELKKSEFENSMEVSNMFEYMYKTEFFLKPYLREK